MAVLRTVYSWQWPSADALWKLSKWIIVNSIKPSVQCYNETERPKGQDPFLAAYQCSYNGKNTKTIPTDDSNATYGNYQQQTTMTQLNQPATPSSMQPMQQTPGNLYQQYEVCQAQPIDLQQTYHARFPPYNYQPSSSQQMYCFHFPPHPSPHLNTTQAAVSSHIVHKNDIEADDSSDKETQDPIYGWQLVNRTKKRKREKSQKKGQHNQSNSYNN